MKKAALNVKETAKIKSFYISLKRLAICLKV